MKTLSKSVIGGALLAAFSSAYAADPVAFSANVALTSDYVWRGVSQTYEDPAIQGGFDMEHASGFSMGTWASNVKFGEDADFEADDGASIEIDLYADYSMELSKDMSVNAGYVHYFYPGADSDDDLDFGEFNLGFSFNMFSLSYAYGPDVGGEETHYIGLGMEYGLPYEYTLGASIGYYDWESENADYTNWMLSVGKSVGGFDFSIAYTDTDIDGADDPDGLTDGRAVFTIAKSF